MSLDKSKLERVGRRDKKIIARCPACAENGGDSKGEHLAIWPDERFDCVANQGDAGHEHRQRIFALVGIRGTGGGVEKLFRVRRPQRGGGIPDMLGTAGTAFPNSRATENSDANDQDSTIVSARYTHKTPDYPSQVSLTPPSSASGKFWVMLEDQARVHQVALPAFVVQGFVNQRVPIKLMLEDQSSEWLEPAAFGFCRVTAAAEEAMATN